MQRSSAAVQEFVSNYPPIRIRKKNSKLYYIRILLNFSDF